MSCYCEEFLLFIDIVNCYCLRLGIRSTSLVTLTEPTRLDSNIYCLLYFSMLVTGPHRLQRFSFEVYCPVVQHKLRALSTVGPYASHHPLSTEWRVRQWITHQHPLHGHVEMPVQSQPSLRSYLPSGQQTLQSGLHKWKHSSPFVV